MSRRLGPSKAVVRAAEMPPGEGGSTAIPLVPLELLSSSHHSSCFSPLVSMPKSRSSGSGSPSPSLVGAAEEAGGIVAA